jgi:uncharacterized membrane protein
MTFLLSSTAIISIGLMIGVEFSVWAFINPILRRLEEPAQSQAVGLFAQKLGGIMPFWYAGNFVLLVAEAVVFRRQPAIWPLAAAAGIWAAVIVLTLIFLAPIANRLARPALDYSLDIAHREQQRWDALHRVRVVALGAAFVLLLIGLHV